jgi:hypothetical protein
VTCRKFWAAKLSCDTQSVIGRKIAVSKLRHRLGSRVPLLHSYRLSPVEVHALSRGGPRPATKLIALVDVLVPELKQVGPPRQSGNQKPFFIFRSRRKCSRRNQNNF